MSGHLRRLRPDQVRRLRRTPVPPEVLTGAARIVEEVRREGEGAVRRWAESLGDLRPGDPLLIERRALEEALDGLPPERREVLERVTGRIRDFAQAQRQALADLDVAVPGGRSGHRVDPVDRAGCYAPGGRFPLPSSVLMTAVTARVAGVPEVWVASPRPTRETLAAAALAGARGLLAVGGAQAIAALALGAGAPRCDLIAGPGNSWVNAAKLLLGGEAGMDLLAGPSELVVLADARADAELVAADLLAQAEHDVEALPVLLTPSATLLEAVNLSLERRLADLPSREIALGSLARGFAVLVGDMDEAVALSDRLAPEHLQVMTREAEAVAGRCRHYGALFLGAGSAEVAGDYGAGPNHTLPTGGAARYSGGLSVLQFLRVRTWLRLDDPAAAQQVYRDAAEMAAMEGLEGHRRAAEARYLPGE
jgi:phosphoribosyl-ATP pyrophosphohydrolase/phosphoribosyl-AMP cyclohydrolase/histidinol dehydrogenase